MVIYYAFCLDVAQGWMNGALTLEIVMSSMSSVDGDIRFIIPQNSLRIVRQNTCRNKYKFLIKWSFQVKSSSGSIATTGK